MSPWKWDRTMVFKGDVWSTCLMNKHVRLSPQCLFCTSPPSLITLPSAKAAGIPFGIPPLHPVLPTPGPCIPVSSQKWLLGHGLGCALSSLHTGPLESVSPFHPHFMLQTGFSRLQILLAGWKKAISVIWSPGGLSTTYQRPCAVGLSPVCYYPEERLPSSRTWVLLGALFSMTLAMGRQPRGEKPHTQRYNIS